MNSSMVVPPQQASIKEDHFRRRNAVSLIPVSALVLLFLLFLTGCSSSEPYPFERPLDEIESIEIVYAENSREFTVLETLSETEKRDFLEQFLTIEFRRIYGMDPYPGSGDGIKITYRDGSYEMVYSRWPEYVKDGMVYFLWMRCDERVFDDLRDSFLKDSSMQFDK